MATTAAPALLERTDMIVRLNVAIVADRCAGDRDILRLIDVRRITDAMEFVNVLYTQLLGIYAIVDSDHRATLRIGGVALSASGDGICS
jgi:hypothetical protein